MNKINDISIIESEKEQLKEINYKSILKTNLIFFIYLFFFILLLGLILVFFFIFKLFNKLLFEVEYFKKQNQNYFNEISNKLLSEVENFKTQNKNYINEINKYSIYKYINEFNLYRMLCPKEVIGKNKILIGTYGDGGYVLLDDFKDIKIAYSFGISNIISFDKDLADKGIDIYMYDHTINNLPFNHQKFHWKKLGITSESKKMENMKTLKEFLIENEHLKENNMT